MTYAGFGLRLVAIIIDWIIIGVLQSFVIVPILVAMGFSMFAGASTMDTGDPEATAGMIAAIMAMAGTFWILAMCIQVLYFSFMESSNLQGTVGKLALGIIVTDMNGAKLDFGKAFIRNLCRIISNMTLFIGYIIAGFTEKRQALHDIIAGTLVIKKNPTAQV
ncbi:MAG TPA: RDD family protein [Cyclobacteriaceae bacterium]